MKKTNCLVALAALLLSGCIVERPVPVTTTEVRHEVVTTEPGGDVLVTQQPPAVRVETQTVSPGANYVWTAGHWRWNGVRYEWVRGTWVIRPRPAAVWVSGHWARRPGGWVWVPGHWS